jgi:HSP20 family molecular chaperone IbpA
MTARLTLNHPMLLGFEQIERTIDRLTKSAGDGYPPYNIEQIDDDRLRITLAVAGFDRETLTIRTEGNQLVVQGRQQEDGQTKLYLHRGIAARQFQKCFLLAEGIEIGEASLNNGLLDIDLTLPKRESQIRTIEITKSRNARDHETMLDVNPDRNQVKSNEGDRI